MDPLYAIQRANDYPNPVGGIGVAILLGGAILVALAALAEHYTGRSNIITRALDRWS